MNSRYTRVIALMMVMIPFLLSGCVRVKTTLVISPEDLVSGQMIVATVPRTNADTGPQLDVDVPFAQKITLSSYRGENYVGQQAIFSGLTFSEVPQLANLNKNANGVNITLRRAGNTVILEGRADLTLLADPEANIDFSVSFPGEITTTNGHRLTDSTVQWQLKPGVVNVMNAQAHYTDPSTRLFVSTAFWFMLATICTAGIVVILAWLGRNRPPAKKPRY